MNDAAIYSFLGGPILALAISIMLSVRSFKTVGWWAILVFVVSLALLLAAYLGIFSWISRRECWWTLDRRNRMGIPNIGTENDYQEMLLERLDWKHDPKILEGLIRRASSPWRTSGDSAYKNRSERFTPHQLVEFGAVARSGRDRALHLVHVALDGMGREGTSGQLRSQIINWAGRVAANRGAFGTRVGLLLLVLDELKQEKGDEAAAIKEAVARYPGIVPLLREAMRRGDG